MGAAEGGAWGGAGPEEGGATAAAPRAGPGVPGAAEFREGEQ